MEAAEGRHPIQRWADEFMWYLAALWHHLVAFITGGALVAFLTVLSSGFQLVLPGATYLWIFAKGGVFCAGFFAWLEQRDKVRSEEAKAASAEAAKAKAETNAADAVAKAAEAEKARASFETDAKVATEARDAAREEARAAKAALAAVPKAKLSLVVDPNDATCIPADTGDHRIRARIKNDGDLRATKVKVMLLDIFPDSTASRRRYFTEDSGADVFEIPAGGERYIDLMHAHKMAGNRFRHSLRFTPHVEVIQEWATLRLTLKVEYDGPFDAVTIEFTKNASGAFRPKPAS